MNKYNVLLAILVLTRLTAAMGQGRPYPWPRPDDPADFSKESPEIAAEIDAIQDSLIGASFLSNEQSSRLLSIVANPRDGLRVRERALVLLCQSAAPADADRLIALLDSWLLRERTPMREADQVPDLSVGPWLETFFRDGAGHLALRIKNPRALLDLYVKIYEPKPLDWFLWTSAGDRIADNPAPLAVRQEYMLRVLRKLPHSPVPATFDALFDERVAPALRDLAFEGWNGTTPGNQGAFGLLVECGDLETVKRLEQVYEDSPKVLEAQRAPGGAIWMIRAKHDPRLLLDHIRSTDPASLEWPSSRLSALRLAIRHGVDRAAIREALLQHYRNCELPELKFQFRAWQVDTCVNRVPLEHEILSAEDLAEIRKRLDESGDSQSQTRIDK